MFKHDAKQDAYLQRASAGARRAEGKALRLDGECAGGGAELRLCDPPGLLRHHPGGHRDRGHDGGGEGAEQGIHHLGGGRGPGAGQQKSQAAHR